MTEGLSEGNASSNVCITQLQGHEGTAVGHDDSLRDLLPFKRFLVSFPVTFLNLGAGSELLCLVERSHIVGVPQLGSHDQTEGT